MGVLLLVLLLLLVVLSVLVLLMLLQTLLHCSRVDMAILGANRRLHGGHRHAAAADGAIPE
ncbi:hypothetical protein JKP88DRAFT_279317 [Tribonema minus]|uniref:Uncharacterized protein n=1 Tax=Tribonema minus TaxID=303371 RepID=A0A835YVH8_9STRA|nr:hypothetical protein JKP88DRAFT_279317 [Tribonema minus]